MNPTPEQLAARLRDANLTPAQQTGVQNGVGYTPSNPSLPYYSASGNAVDTPPAPINRPITPIPAQTPNSVSSANTSSTGVDTSTTGTDVAGGGTDGSTDAEKKAQDYLDSSLQTPETEDQIIARKTAEASDRIQANKDYYQSLLTDQAGVNDLRTRETNANSVLNGLSGSSEAGNAAVVTATKNSQANAGINAQQNVALQAIYKDIQDSAYTELQTQKSDAYKSATDILARKDANKTKAVNDITTLAKSGFDFSAIKASDPVTYQHLADSVGGEDQLNALAVLNKPQNTIIDKQVINGQYVVAYQNPLTGKTSIESTDLGLPPQYTKTIDAGDKLIAIPDNWDGTTVNQGSTPGKNQGITISKGLAPKAPSTSTATEKGTIVSGGLTYTPEDAQEDTQALESSRGEDHFVDPSIYQQLYQAWVNHGGLLKDFVAKYPPKLYVNPANTWLPSFLMPAKPAGTSRTA